MIEPEPNPNRPLLRQLLRQSVWNNQANRKHFKECGVNMFVSSDDTIVLCHGVTWPGWKTDSEKSSVES